MVGLIPQQYIYCELCNAYSATRAQNLVKQCQGRRYYSRAVDRLMRGVHPEHDTDLCTQPRRLTRNDVGTDYWCAGRESLLEGIDATYDDDRLESAEPMERVARAPFPHSLVQ